GEEWTFHAEGWPGPAIAWLALDDEPEGQGEQALRAACEAALSPGPLVALTTADQRLDGALCAGLLASADPLSRGLAQAFVTTTTKDS
ncbi:MAG TPA: hypothetical protein VGR16_02655, partial [Thermomicrobiales bacterium]|nr:hypothetical protein [Thermomicrobiales bacterium]